MKFLFNLSIALVIFATNYTNVFANNIEAKIFDYINKKDWQNADELAKKFKNSALIKIIKSQKLLDCDSNNDFEEAVIFIQNNPQWPTIAAIKNRAEKFINDNTNKQLIVKWFNSKSPVTANGYKYYALAAEHFIKETSKLKSIVKNGWVYGNFNPEEEKKYLAHFSKYLNEEDHLKRIDEHLWNNKLDQAERSLYLVDSEYRKVLKATIAAISGNDNKEDLFKQIPEKYYTPSLLYYYLQSKKKEVPDHKSIALFKKVKSDAKHAHEWCRLQLYYAREFIDQKDFLSSYKIITTHFAADEENIREAEWLSGWLALRFLKKPDLALGHFKKFLEVAEKPISIARGKYWLARTYAQQKDLKSAHKLYKEASIYPYTFYGQLAQVELKDNRINLPAMPKGEIHHKKTIERNDIFKAMRLLLKYGKPQLAHSYAKALIKHITPEELFWLAQVIMETKNYHYITDFGKHATQQHIFLKDFAFPIPYKLQSKSVEPAIVYSIIKQESVFDQHAISSAKAMGLMQLIKDTACRTAKDLNVACNVSKLTKDPVYNIKLGTHQLKMLIDERKNSLILTFSSYNAATSKVNKWIKRFGDPRDLTDHRQVVDWIELIPFSETRNYVQRVLENVQVYRAIINNSNELKLKQDLGV